MNQYNDIDDIIAKYLCGEATPEEAMMLDDWRKSSTLNETHFITSQKSLQFIDKTTTSKPNVEEAWSNIQKKMKESKYNVNKLYLWSVLVLLIISASYYFYNQIQQAKEIEAIDVVVNTTLPDQSTVSLDKKSSITLAADFGKNSRKLMLKGKGTFEVEHDDKKPFIIQTSNVYIEDLGTKFSVSNYPDSDTVYVVVEEGIVRLYDQEGNEIIIKAGEKAWYVKSKKLIITDSGARIIKFNFNDTKLEDVIKLIHETYGESISLSPTSIGQCKITTQFFDEDISTIITILAETLDFKYEYKDGKYIIEGKPCQ